MKVRSVDNSFKKDILCMLKMVVFAPLALVQLGLITLTKVAGQKLRVISGPISDSVSLFGYVS